MNELERLEVLLFVPLLFIHGFSGLEHVYIDWFYQVPNEFVPKRPAMHFWVVTLQHSIKTRIVIFYFYYVFKILISSTSWKIIR